MEQNKIIIIDIIKILKSKWISIVVMNSIIIILGVILNFFIITPTYEVSVKIFIGIGENKNSYNVDEVEMYNKLLKTYSQLIQTNDLIERALKKEDIGVEEKEVLKFLTVTPYTDTQILQIKYENKDNLLAKRILEAIVNEFREEAPKIIPNSGIKIIENVKVPEEPTHPKKIINIVAIAVMGLILTLGVIFLLDNINNTFKSKEELERKSKLPVIGVIPKENRKRKKKFIVENILQSIEAEAYRNLRTNIQYSLDSSETKIMLITSAQNEDGKATIASKLALSFSEDNKLVILVDCNFRNPSISKMFNIKDSFGLSDFLIGQADLNSTIKSYNRNLDILPSGNTLTNPTELLNSVAMKLLLEDLKEKYDMVILDSTPIGIVVDTQILSTEVDGAIFVVMAEKTNVENLNEAQKLLRNSGANIIGTIFNEVTINRKKLRKYYKLY